MTCIIVIAPALEEPGDDRAIAARAFIAAYATAGLHVHAITTSGFTARPAFECDGIVNIHRLDTDAEQHPAAFAARALERARDIASQEPCHAIECFDAPACATIGAAAHTVGILPCPVLHLHPCGRISDGAAPFAGLFSQNTQSFSRASAPPSARIVNLPTIPCVIPHPPMPGPAFVLPMLREPEAQALIVTAFNEISSTLPGWSLACATGDGRWMNSPTDGARHTPQSVERPPRIWIAAGSPNQDPIACRILLASGQLCIVSDDSPLFDAIPGSLHQHLSFRAASPGSLAQRMSALARSTVEQRSDWSRLIASSLNQRFDANSFIEARHATWRSGAANASSDATRQLWTNLEHSLAERCAPIAETIS